MIFCIFRRTVLKLLLILKKWSLKKCTIIIACDSVLVYFKTFNNVYDDFKGQTKVIKVVLERNKIFFYCFQGVYNTWFKSHY